MELDIVNFDILFDWDEVPTLSFLDEAATAEPTQGPAGSETKHSLPISDDFLLGFQVEDDKVPVLPDQPAAPAPVETEKSRSRGKKRTAGAMEAILGPEKHGRRRCRQGVKRTLIEKSFKVENTRSTLWFIRYNSDAAHPDQEIIQP